MPALFPPWTNIALRLGLVGGALCALGLPTLLMVYVRMPWNTAELEAVDQPVEFDHRHHAVDDEIECLYCHFEAERSPFAGVPATEVCMGCHVQIWNESPLLEPVRRSMFTGQPLPWNRVHQIGDFAYFDHSVHVGRGIGCVHCHGRVDRMARVFKVAPLTMGWCLDCHRNPKRVLTESSARLLALDSAPDTDTQPSSLWGQPPERLGRELRDTGFAVTALTTCSACHR